MVSKTTKSPVKVRIVSGTPRAQADAADGGCDPPRMLAAARQPHQPLPRPSEAAQGRPRVSLTPSHRNVSEIPSKLRQISSESDRAQPRATRASDSDCDPLRMLTGPPQPRQSLLQSPEAAQCRPRSMRTPRYLNDQSISQSSNLFSSEIDWTPPRARRRHGREL